MSLFYEPNKAKLDRLIEDATLSSGATILIPNLQRAYVTNQSADVSQVRITKTRIEIGENLGTTILRQLPVFDAGWRPQR